MDSTQIAIATAVAALLTSVATLFSILELKAQRRGQNRPELILEEVGFRALRVDSVSVPPRVTFALEDAFASSGKCWREDLPIRVQNVGRGVARDVTATWSFDVNAFATTLLPYEEIVGGKVLVDKSSIQLKGKEGLHWLMGRNSRVRMGAILPAPIGQGKIVPLDSAYGLMAKSFFAVASVPKNIGFFNDHWLPAIQLTLSYQDLEGNKYSKSIQVEFQLVIETDFGFQDYSDEWLEIAHGYLLVQDI